MGNKVEINLTKHGEGTVRINGVEVMVRRIEFSSEANGLNVLILAIPVKNLELVAKECKIELNEA